MKRRRSDVGTTSEITPFSPSATYPSSGCPSGDWERPGDEDHSGRRQRSSAVGWADLLGAGTCLYLPYLYSPFNLLMMWLAWHSLRGMDSAISYHRVRSSLPNPARGAA